MADLPQPPVPPDLDLRAYDYMPLKIERLLASDTWAMATGDEAKALVTLWSRAWHQVPAGSLPDDDRVLAVLSGAGARWRKVKGVALRGFVKCSDGRLYHDVICEEALVAEEKRGRTAEQRAGNRERVRRWREAQRAIGNGAGNDAVTVTDGITGAGGNGAGDADVTPPSHARARDRARDGTKTGIENNNNPEPPTTPPRAGAPPGSKTLAQSLGQAKPQRERSKAEIRDIWLQGIIARHKAVYPPAVHEKFILGLMEDPWPIEVKREVERLDQEAKAERVVTDHGGTPERTAFGIAAVREA